MKSHVRGIALYVIKLIGRQLLSGKIDLTKITFPIITSEPLTSQQGNSRSIHTV